MGKFKVQLRRSGVFIINFGHFLSSSSVFTVDFDGFLPTG